MSLGKAARRLPSPNGLYGKIASLAARRWASLTLIGAIVAMDRSLPWQGWGFAVRALLDEPCHVATGLVCLGAITRFRGRPPGPGLGWAMLICSTAIDLDHLPLALGSSVLTAGTPRPYTHALWVVAVLALGALAARCWPRRAGRASPAAAASIMLGAACGVSAHFLRDAGTAPMALWWPVTPAAVQVHYRWYAVAIVVIALMPATWPSRPSRATRPPRPATSRHEPLLPGDFSDPVRPETADAGIIRVGCRMARVITRERFLGGSSAQYGTPKSRRELPALSTGREANH